MLATLIPNSSTPTPSTTPTTTSTTTTTTTSATTSTSATTTDQDTPGPQPIFVAISDSQSVHVTLDESIEDCFQNPNGPNLAQDNTSSNIFIIIGFISTAIVASLHFWEWKFQQPVLNQYTLPCVAVFFALQIYLNFFLGTPGLLFRSTPYKVNGTRRRLDIYVGHQMYDENYTVKMDLITFGSKKTSTVVEHTFQVTSFFDTNGRFLQEEFFEALIGLYNSALNNKKDA